MKNTKPNLEQSNQQSPISQKNQSSFTIYRECYRWILTDKERQDLQQASKLMPQSLRLKIKEYLDK